MITLKPIIIQGNTRKDGTTPVYIRLTQHGVTRRLPTNIICRPSDLTRGGRIKSADIISKGNALCDRMRATLDTLPPSLVDTWTADQVAAHIRQSLAGDDFRLDFFAFGEAYAEGMKAAPKTRKSYLWALNALERYIGRRSLDVNEITRALLLGFVDYIDAEPKMHRKTAHRGVSPTSVKKVPGGASSRAVAKLSAIYEAAKFKYNDEDTGCIRIPRSPFRGLDLKTPPSKGQDALSVEVMQRVIDARGETRTERTALAVFVVSFLTQGANLADLYRQRDFAGDVWRYNRKKTEHRRADGAEMRVTLQPELSEFVGRLRSAGPRGWWLPALHLLGTNADGCTLLVNRGLRSWCEREGLPPFTFYAARHTWATLARRIGVEKATVDEALCHVGDFSVADIYAERAWHLHAEANRRVISLFSF